MTQFFMVSSNGKFASYLGADERTTDLLLLPEPPTSWSAPKLVEYLGDPPKKPKRKGDYHATANAHFFSARALNTLSAFLEPAGSWLPISIEGRPEAFLRYWVTKVVDCLDVELSITVNVRKIPGSVGVIRKPVFKMEKWDGSHVFRVPEDPNFNCFVTDTFVAACQVAKVKGIQFMRESFDPDPISV